MRILHVNRYSRLLEPHRSLPGHDLYLHVQEQPVTRWWRGPCHFHTRALRFHMPALSVIGGFVGAMIEETISKRSSLMIRQCLSSS